ncbi:MAG: hypothetical protein PHE78_08515 [Candidatus Gastranaerophilales bacterium]|nr:hypothetical protein [Candidatus Gastranaerophilales bacterium]
MKAQKIQSPSFRASTKIIGEVAKGSHLEKAIKELGKKGGDEISYVIKMLKPEQIEGYSISAHHPKNGLFNSLRVFDDPYKHSSIKDIEEFGDETQKIVAGFSALI